MAKHFAEMNAVQLDKSYLDGYEYIQTVSELYELTLDLMQNSFDNE